MQRLFPAAVQTALLLLLAVCAPVRADAVPFSPSDDVSYRTADVISEGVRLTAEVFAPASAAGGGKLPTIVMCHGWGGLAEYLRPDAVVFAEAGYLVVTFDYRGWGASDGRLVAVGKKPASTGSTLTAEVKEIRGVVDPVEQTTDLMSVIHWTMGDKQCDPARLGLWGCSYGGGHVLYVAARDPRIKALVSQVGGMDSRFVTADLQLRTLTYQQGTARAQGKLGYPKPGEKFGALNGMPVLEKLVGYAPVEEVGRIKHCAMLFLVAQNDEVVDNRAHGLLAYARAAEAQKAGGDPQHQAPRHLRGGTRTCPAGSARLVQRAPEKVNGKTGACPRRTTGFVPAKKSVHRFARSGRAIFIRLSFGETFPPDHLDRRPARLAGRPRGLLPDPSHGGHGLHRRALRLPDGFLSHAQDDLDPLVDDLHQDDASRRGAGAGVPDLPHRAPARHGGGIDHHLHADEPAAGGVDDQRTVPRSPTVQDFADSR